MNFDLRSREIMILAYGAGISCDQSREMIRVKLEEICLEYVKELEVVKEKNDLKDSVNQWVTEGGKNSPCISAQE